jgi:hypothetical protein
VSLAGVPGFDRALEMLRAAGQCWLVNPHRGLAGVQAAARKVFDGGCLLTETAGREGAAGVIAARDRGAWTLWGHHPSVRLGDVGVRRVVLGDPALLRPLRAWTVAASPRGDEARRLIATIRSPALQARLAAFRLAGDAVNQPWWPLAAVRPQADVWRQD